MIVQILQPEVLELIEKREFSALKEVLLEWTPTDIADLINELPHITDQAILFRLMPASIQTDIFEYLDVDVQIDLLKALGKEEVAAVLNDMSADDRTALLEEMPANITKQLLLLLSPEERMVAQKLLGYPENSIGRLMTPDYIAVEQDWTVEKVMQHIRAHGKNSETLNIIYVVDKNGLLIDDIKIRQILLSPLEQKVEELMDGNFVHLKVNDDQEAAVEVFKKYDRVALPVTNENGILIGIVTVDDVLDVAEEEATEDIQKLGAVEALDEPYSTTPLWEMVKKRAGWLSILFIGELLTASAMGFFEHEIQKAVVLALFVPLIISSGGNAGSQATTLVIRALALGEITVKDWFFILRREFSTGLILGTVLAVLGMLRIFIGELAFDAYGVHWIGIGLSVSFALIGVVMWGTIIGSILPLILKKLGFDPATASAPFVATLVDVTGLVIYFSLAMLFLSGSLL